MASCNKKPPLPDSVQSPGRTARGRGGICLSWARLRSCNQQRLAFSSTQNRLHHGQNLYLPAICRHPCDITEYSGPWGSARWHKPSCLWHEFRRRLRLRGCCWQLDMALHASTKQRSHPQLVHAQNDARHTKGRAACVRPQLTAALHHRPWTHPWQQTGHATASCTTVASTRV